jgi:hypothetical protein
VGVNLSCEVPPCGLQRTATRYIRDNLRYPSDLTDEEWAHIERLIPPAKRGGGKWCVNTREVVNAVMYIHSVYRLPMALSSQRPAPQEHRA